MATKLSNVSSKYKDFISKSILRPSGFPAVYQLETKKENIGTLTKLTVGEKDVNKINKTILLVGETGAGKSALVNALVNYTMGVKWEEEVWFKIVDEEKSKENQTESQTSDVIVYEVLGFEDETLPYSVTIIDTPGFGDTNDIERDKEITERLLDLFRSDDGVHEVNAVGLVMKASVNRLTDRLMYVLNSVMSLFGKDLEENIVALITHSDGRNPKNPLQAIEAAKIKCARNEENQPVYFLFNNCQDEDRTEAAKVLEGHYEISERGMREFTAFLFKNGPQRVIRTAEVLNDRVRLTACIQNLKERIDFIEQKQTEIKQTKEALKKHEEEMKKNKNFTVEVDEIYKEKEPIDGGWRWFGGYQGAVCCTVCEETCHYPCNRVWYPSHCKVMKGGRCTSCTNKCPASKHVKDKWRYVTKTRRVKKTLEDIKKKYEENQEESDKKLSLLENLEKDRIELTAEKRQLVEEAYQHVVRLNQIALKAESVSTYIHLDFLIEKMKEKGDTEKVQELEEMKRRMDEKTRAAVEYKAKLTSVKEK